MMRPRGRIGLIGVKSAGPSHPLQPHGWRRPWRDRGTVALTPFRPTCTRRPTPGLPRLKVDSRWPGRKACSANGDQQF